MKENSNSFHESFSMFLTFTSKKSRFYNGSTISQSNLKQILDGRYPTLSEFAAIKRFFPSLKKYSKEIHDNQEDAKLSRRNKKQSQQIEISVPSEPHKVSSVSSKEEIVASDNLVIKSNLEKIEKAKDQSAQYTVVETVDPGLAAVLLDGNHKNRSLSTELVEAIARDIVSGKWIVSHQGIALDKDGKLLDGQHRLNAVIKSGLTIQIPVTYNVPQEAFNVIDMNNRPRTIADMQGISRSIPNARRVVAAAKTISALDGGYKDRYTNSEVDEILNKFQEECSWASRVLGGKNPSAGVTAGFAYAYPTNKQKIEEIAKSFSSKVGMSDTLAALHRAAERIGRGNEERVDLAFLTMRAIRSELKEGKDKETRSLFLRKEGGEGKAIAYRSFRALRVKLGLAE